MQLTGMEILELKEEIGEKEKDFLAKEKELNWLYETSMAKASGNIKASGDHCRGDEERFWNILDNILLLLKYVIPAFLLRRCM